MDEYFVEEKSAWDTILDFLVFLSVLIVTIFLILGIMGQAGKIDGSEGLNYTYLYLSVAIFIVFVLDLVRLWRKSSGPKDFFEHNWLDVMATIPFELLAFWITSFDPETVSTFALLKWFRFTKIARAAKINKIARVSKVTKEFKAAAHLKKEGEEYKKKNRL